MHTGTIPAELGHLGSLVKLDLRVNNLSGDVLCLLVVKLTFWIILLSIRDFACTIVMDACRKEGVSQRTIQDMLHSKQPAHLDIV